MTALRSLLRFLHVDGRIPAPLAGRGPGGGRLAAGGLPAGCPRACRGSVADATRDRGRAAGSGSADDAGPAGAARRRGRRPQLEDIDWRPGRSCPGQGQPRRAAAAAAEVGQALAEYLTGTVPVCGHGRVPDRAGSPPPATDREAVRAIMARACARAGLPRLGAHRLRHTLASDLLRAGTSLPRSARCCVTAASCPPRSTPRSTPPGCGTWPGPGRDGADRHDDQRPHRPTA